MATVAILSIKFIFSRIDHQQSQGRTKFWEISGFCSMHDLCFLAVHQKRVRLVYDNTISLAICRHIYLHIYTHTQTHNRAEFHTNFKSSKVGHPPPPHTPSPCGRHHHDWALHFPAKYHAESLSAPSWRVCMYACWYRHNHISYIANHHQLGTISMSLESALVCGCVRACMYVCVYIFIRMYNHLYIRIHMSKFSSKLTEKLLPVVDSIVTPPCRVIIFLKTQLYRHSISGRWISSSTSTCTCTHRNHLPVVNWVVVNLWVSWLGFFEWSCPHRDNHRVMKLLKKL